MKKRTGLILLAVIAAVSAAAAAGYVAVRKSGEKKIQESILNSVDEKEVKKEISSQGETYHYRDGLINILCLGIGKNKPMDEQVAKSNTYGQSDAVYLLSIDTRQKKVRVISIPRETIVPIDRYYTSGQYQMTEDGQLCLQYAYGDGKKKSADLTVKAVKNVFGGIPIQRVCAINFQAIPVINDAIGGVAVKITEDMSGYAPGFKQGTTVRLKGKQAITYLQERDCSVFKSSMDRVKRQERYMKAFVKQAKKAVKKNPSVPLTVYKSLSKNMYTDIRFDEVTYLVSSVLGYSFSTKDMYSVPGEMKMGSSYEEFYIDQKATQKMVLELFYKKSS